MFSEDRDLGGIALTSKGTVVAFDNKSVAGINALTGEVVWSFAFKPGTGGGIAMSPSEDFFALYAPNNIHLFLTETGTPLTRPLQLKALLPKIARPPSILSVTIGAAGDVTAHAGGYEITRKAPLPIDSLSENIKSVESRTGISGADGQTKIKTLLGIQQTASPGAANPNR